jgi:ribonuclease VapC
MSSTRKNGSDWHRSGAPVGPGALPRTVAHYLADPIFEAAPGICRKRHASVEEAEQDVGEFLGLAGVRTVPVTDQEAHTALAAFSRYGMGRRHPAQLNLGDCFAYAVAKNYRTTLLFKGEDFDKTDLRRAARSR